MAKFEKDKQYEGFITNYAIKKHRETIKFLEVRMKAEQAAIDEIQAACDHIYYFYCSGAYEDTYICIRCGHKTVA